MSSPENDDAQENEFDVVARWTADALVGSDRTSAIAGACRGSGSPSVLAWLAETLQFEPGLRVLDVGAGLGGPSAWATDHYGVLPVALEPMPGACRGSARLFEHPVGCAAAEALPLRTASIEAAWTLAVFDTVEKPSVVLREVRRVLRPSGRFGVLAYIATKPLEGREIPEGNHFQSADEFLAEVTSAGFEVFDQVESTSLAPPPRDWKVIQDELDDQLAERHGEDPRWQQSTGQEERFGRLLDDEAVQPLLLHLVAT